MLLDWRVIVARFAASRSPRGGGDRPHSGEDPRPPIGLSTRDGFWIVDLVVVSTHAFGSQLKAPWERGT